MTVADCTYASMTPRSIASHSCFDSVEKCRKTNVIILSCRSFHKIELSFLVQLPSQQPSPCATQTKQQLPQHLQLPTSCLLALFDLWLQSPPCPPSSGAFAQQLCCDTTRRNPLDPKPLRNPRPRAGGECLSLSQLSMLMEIQPFNSYAWRSRSCSWRSLLLPHGTTGESKGNTCRGCQVEARQSQISEEYEKMRTKDEVMHDGVSDVFLGMRFVRGLVNSNLAIFFNCSLSAALNVM